VQSDNLQNVLCNPTNEEALPSQGCVELTCTIPTPGRGFDITIMGDATTRIAECDEANNLSSISQVFCPGAID
jgi:hypothetical protein